MKVRCRLKNCFFRCSYLKKALASNVGNQLLQRSCCGNLVTIAERFVNIPVLIFMSSLNSDAWSVLDTKGIQNKNGN